MGPDVGPDELFLKNQNENNVKDVKEVFISLAFVNDVYLRLAVKQIHLNVSTRN